MTKRWNIVQMHTVLDFIKDRLEKIEDAHRRKRFLIL